MERIVCLTLTFSVAGSLILDPDPLTHPPNLDHHHTLDHDGLDLHECHGPDCELIEKAINNIGLYFDNHLCHTLKNVDCQNHILPLDEQLCGSDGITYPNHCSFVKARCFNLLDKHVSVNHLLLRNRGPCMVTTATTSTHPSMSTKFTTTKGDSTASTTTGTLNNLLVNVFCKNRWSVDCGQNINIVCGSDGNNYPNECELLKWQCENPTLRKAADSSSCSTP